MCAVVQDKLGKRPCSFTLRVNSPYAAAALVALLASSARFSCVDSVHKKPGRERDLEWRHGSLSRSACPAAAAGRQTLRKAGWAAVEWDWLGTGGDGRGTPLPHAVPAAGGTCGKQLTWNGAAAAKTEGEGGRGHGGNGLWERGSSGRKLSTRTYKRVE